MFKKSKDNIDVFKFEVRLLNIRIYKNLIKLLYTFFLLTFAAFIKVGRASSPLFLVTSHLVDSGMTLKF